jgi:hypothetical protein
LLNQFLSNLGQALFFMPRPKGEQMANNVAKAKIYEQFLDNVVKAGLTSADFTSGNVGIRYNGANTVEIPTASVTGSTDYDRTTGFKKGNGSLTFTPYIIRRDRQFSFLVDAMDQDESGGVFNSSVMLNEYTANHAIPEMDSYRYQEVAQAVLNDLVTTRFSRYTPAAATLLTTFQSDITEIRKAVGHGRVLKAKMAESSFGILTNSTELSKQLQVQQVTGSNGVTTDIYKINGVEIVPVPDDRMMTEYTFATGASFGFSAKAWAQQMNWFIYANDAIKAFEKHNRIYAFDAGEHTEGDGDLLQGRLVDDCWVLENKLNMIRVSLKDAAAPTIDALGGDVDNEADNMEITLGDAFTNRDTGHKFYYLDTNSQTAPTAPKVYDEIDLTSYTEITVATEVNVTIATDDYGVVVAVDENGRVIGYTAIKVV